MTVALPPMPRENVATRIYRALKEQLMSGALRPGEPITLRSVSESLGVSQTPVREALLQLVSERALTLSPGKSVIVPVLTEAQLVELRDIRLELECMAARRAVPNVSEADLEEMGRVHTELARGRAEQDSAAVMKANLAFHFALYKASRMPHLVSMIENLWVQTASYLTYMYRPPFPALDGAHPHKGILAALQARDTDGAIAELRRDIEGHGAFLMAVLRERGILAP